jgi:phospholipid transport system transporter-binding protein
MSTEAAALFRLDAADDGCLEACGPLTFASARAARELGLATLCDGGRAALQIDCRGINPSDSAGLAVLLDWLAAARQAGRGLTYRALPEDLTALARISEVEGFLEKGV